MSFAEALSKGFQNYANFSGRARRSEYWYFALANFLIRLVALMLAPILGQEISDLLTVAVSLVFFVPLLSAAVRRMHDTNHSGWWILVPVVNLIYAVSEGDAGPNRFGPATK